MITIQPQYLTLSKLLDGPSVPHSGIPARLQLDIE